jgi:hypothetical protein
MFKKNEVMDKSTFIKERYFNEYDKFNTGILENPKRFAKWMLTATDELGTKFVWNAHYQKALSEGISDPIRFADGETRKLVAGRGVGEVPLAQKAKLFQLVAPFQLEVMNIWHVMKDFVDEKAFGKLATLFVMNYIMNKGAEAIRGNPVTLDPIQATIDALGELDGEDGILKAGGRLAGEAISNLPLGQTAAALYPEFGANIGGKQLPTRQEFFGRSDPTRFGGGGLIARGAQDPLYKLLPPFGGQQIKRTVDAAQAQLQGGDFAKDGSLKFEQSPSVQGLVFGKFATPEGREYLRTQKSQGLSQPEQQAQSFNSQFKEEQAVDKKEAYQMYQQLKQTKSADERSQLMIQWEEQGLLTDEMLDEFDSFAGTEEAKGDGEWAKAVRKSSTSNDGRAKFILNSIKGKTPEEKRKIFIQLEEAGLLTNELLDSIDEEILANE